MDEVRLLAHWMYLHRESTLPVRWTPNRDIDDFLEEILRQVEEPLLQI